jgi:hypothetical protein
MKREDGAALLFVAMAMLLILGIAALVVDLGAVRFDLRADRLASDLAATAGAAALDPFDTSAGPQEACGVAKAYALFNLGETAWDIEPDCTRIPATCDASTTPPDPSVSGDVGPYHVEIVYPVPDDSPLMAERSIDTEVDGAPCQRIGVTVTRNRDYTFAKVLGFDEETTEVVSVAKYGAGPGLGEVVPLVLLEPHDCEALYTSGQGKVTVKYFDDTPGLIVVDSDATNCGPSSPYAIDAQGVQKGWIRALPVPGQTSPYVPEIPSAILSYALLLPGSAANSYDPADLTDPINPADLTDPTEPTKTWFRLYPKPTPIAARVTRAPLDYRYNCKTGYPNYDTGVGSTVPIPDCPDADGTNDYIDQLAAAYGGAVAPSGASVGTGGFTTWTTYTGDPNYPTGFPCSFQGSDPSPVVPDGNWYVDCSGTAGNQGFTIDNTVVFGPGDIVFEGQVRSLSGGSLSFNNGGAYNHIVYIRHGNFIKDAQSSISLEHVMVYLAGGRVDFNGGDGGLTWTAPDLASGAPVVTFEDHFEDLALWSESSLLHHIGGQAGNTLEGTFFTPYANPFEISGQGSQFQTEAQFVTRKLELSGQAEVRMEPNPDRFTPIPLRDIRLIR